MNVYGELNYFALLLELIGVEDGDETYLPPNVDIKAIWELCGYNKNDIEEYLDYLDYATCDVCKIYYLKSPHYCHTCLGNPNECGRCARDKEFICDRCLLNIEKERKNEEI